MRNCAGSERVGSFAPRAGFRGALGMTFLFLAFCPAADAQNPQFRAFWADAFSVGFKSNSQINSLVSRAVTGKYNAIVAEVLAYHDTGGSGHGAYWNSSIVPRASDISGGIDPLANLVAAAHTAGLEVHAWIVPYRVSTAWPPNGNSQLAAHPEWLMVPLNRMNTGPATVGGAYTLDPGSNDAQEYLVSIVRELVTRYAIDGINFDYIRYVQTDAGYPAYSSYMESSLARFQQLTGYPGVPASSGEPAWDDFRRRTINEYVRRTRAEIAAITSNPRQPLRFTADLICFGNAPTSFEFSSAYTLFQDWRLWMQNGWLDAGIPMNYKREYDPNQAAWYRNWVNAALGWRYDRHLFAGQANYLNRKADSITQMQYALNAGANGTCNFSYDATADENTDDVPEQDWNWYAYVGANLFTLPAPTPDMPWRDPPTATEGTLWGRVTDPATGNPIDGANVQVGTMPATETDGNGFYVVTMIPAAPGGTAYDVIATEPGCAGVQVHDVVITPAGLTRIDIGICDSAPDSGDMDQDGDIDWGDFQNFAFCLRGPGFTYGSTHFCTRGDANADLDVDMHDLARFQTAFGR